MAVAAARHYSRRSGASTRSPGHVLAGRKAPPIARPSGRAQEDPELAPSGWPAHQAQPLPWLFPNFRACGASSSLLPCPIPSTLFSPSLAVVITIATATLQPRELSPFSIPLAPISPSLLFSPPLHPPYPRWPRRDSYLMRYRVPNGEIRTSNSGEHRKHRVEEFPPSEKCAGEQRAPFADTLAGCVFLRYLRPNSVFALCLFYVLRARECIFLSTRLNFGNLRPRL